MFLFYSGFLQSMVVKQCRLKYLAPALLVVSISLTVFCTAQPALSRVEYYIDTDPGFGNATAISFTAGTTNLTDLAIPINPAAVCEGVHRLYVRAKSANGWSMTNKWLFYKPYGGGVSPPAPAPASNISRIEYYFDSDPGFGNATSVAITAGIDIANLVIPVDPATLSEGVHRLYLRVKSANGWSMTNKWLFYKPYGDDETVPAVPVPNLTSLEYYVDTDPGIGNGVPVAFEVTKNLQNADIFINIGGLTGGDHHLYIRGKDGNGAWSMVNDKLFTITAAQASPSLIVNSISRTTLCAGDSFAIGFHSAGSYNVGNTFKMFLSDAGGSFTNETEIGTVAITKSGLMTGRLPSHLPDGIGYKIRVKSNNPAVTGASSSTTLTIRDRPNPGPDSTFYIVCQGEKVNLLPGYNIIGITASWNTATPNNIGAGVYRLSSVNTYGCRDTAYATVKQDIGVWTGDVSMNWHLDNNWSNGHVPTEKTHVIVPAGVSKVCTVTNANGIAASLQVLTGGSLKLTNGKSIDIKANCKPLPNK